MRATYLAFRLAAASCALASAGCAEGGISDDELAKQLGEQVGGDGGVSDPRPSDAGKDARASGGGDDTGTPSSGNRDSGTQISTGNKDAGGTSGSKDAGGGSATPIKCPSPLVCGTSISSIISLIDPSVKSTDNLCANTSGFLPMAVSCSTTDECHSSRLTTATCTAGSCVQPCTP